jgi:hypothetical protein
MKYEEPKYAPLTEKILRMAEESRKIRENQSPMTLEEFLAQTPKPALVNMVDGSQQPSSGSR